MRTILLFASFDALRGVLRHKKARQGTRSTLTGLKRKIQRPYDCNTKWERLYLALPESIKRELIPERKTVRRFLFWWSARLQIRTENRRNIRKRHCLRPVFIIIRENQPVVKYIDAVEEDIDDLSLVFLVVRIAIFKPADPLV